MSGPTPDDVLEFKDATEGFLCDLDANTYELTFLSFVMKDYESKEVIFEISEDSPLPEIDFDEDTFTADQLRTIKYDFNADVLRKDTISTTLVFSNGPDPLEGFRMIERHYFRDVLIKSFDFDFGFVIPNTTNTWESVYTMPTLPEELIAEIIAHPYEVKSDSFYFAGDKLIMHNKAEYRYFEDGSGVAKASIPSGASDGKAGDDGQDSKEAGSGKTADDDEDEDVDSESKAGGEGSARFSVSAAGATARADRGRASSKTADSDDDT